MSPGNFYKCFSCLLLLAQAAFSQLPTDRSTWRDMQRINDSLYTTYLSDTLHAADKINTLVEEAIHGNADPEQTVLKFQMGLSLAPYAQDSSRVLARLYAQFSSWLFSAGALDLAIEYGKTALSYGNKMNASDVTGTMIYHLKSRIAIFYQNSGQYDSSKKYYSMALKEALKLQDPIYASSAINNTGYLYECMHLPDSALRFFNEARHSLVVISKADSDFLGSIQDNIAGNYFSRNNISGALELYKSNEQLYRDVGNYPRLIQAKTGVIKCLLEQKDFKDAYTVLNEIDALSSAEAILRMPEFRLKILDAHKLYYSAIGDWQTTLHYDEMMDALNDSVNQLSRKAIDNIVRASTENEVAKADKEIRLQKASVARAKEKAWQNLLITMMVSLLSVAVVILLVFYFRNRNRVIKYEQQLTMKELENKKLEQEKLEQELKYRKGDIRDLGVYLSQIKGLHENISLRLKDAKAQDSRQQKDILQEVLKELDSKNDLEERAELVQQNIHRVNTEFYETLTRKFPSLTKSEMDLCGLLKLNLSNKEIAALKNISPDSVKMARNRLRKKIGIQPEEDIYAFISNI